METGKNCVVFIFEQKGKEISDKSWYNSPELVVGYESNPRCMGTLEK